MKNIGLPFLLLLLYTPLHAMHDMVDYYPDESQEAHCAWTFFENIRSGIINLSCCSVVDNQIDNGSSENCPSTQQDEARLQALVKLAHITESSLQESMESFDACINCTDETVLLKQIEIFKGKKKAFEQSGNIFYEKFLVGDNTKVFENFAHPVTLRLWRNIGQRSREQFQKECIKQNTSRITQLDITLKPSISALYEALSYVRNYRLPQKNS